MRRIHVIILFCLFFGSALSQNKRNIIEKTTFINNDRIGSKILINQIELKPPSMLRFNSIEFDRRLLKLDAINLKNFYNANGFLEVAIKDSFNISNGLVEIFFIISEGRQYFLSEAKINGLQSINHEEVLEKLGLKIGEPYNPVKINTNLSMLNDMLENEGKIFSSIEVDQVINDSVDVLIMVDEGKKAYLNNLWISGLERIDSSYVKKEITFNEGELFSKKRIDKTKRNLLEVGFFSSVNIVAHPVVNADSLVDLEIRLREFKNVGETSLEFGLDEIETVPGVRSLIGLGGSVNWTDRMILGTKNRFETDGTVVLPTEEGFIFP
ncbi:MAG: POTRA domain-containing protein, partial [Candidatus Neomarinimicrobiota bacterium]|nr:POTRA domain-containing protein [Candidatus Neomarinimicrobiota bacterium]